MVASCYNVKSFRKVCTIHCIASLHIMNVQSSTDLFARLRCLTVMALDMTIEREILCFIRLFDRILACDV